MTIPIPKSFKDKCDELFLNAQFDPVLQRALRKLEEKCIESDLTMYEMVFTLAYKDALDKISRDWLSSLRTTDI